MRLIRISNGVTGENKSRLHDWVNIINTLERLLPLVRSAEVLPGQDKVWIVFSEWIINYFLSLFLFFPPKMDILGNQISQQAEELRNIHSA